MAINRVELQGIEKPIKSLEEFIAFIINHFSQLTPNSFYEKKRVFFRGQNNNDYPLLPSISRKILSKDDVTYLRFEDRMINTAKLQNPEEFCDISYPFNMLAKMQHYGIPTRLLDFTENALVALYFACKGEYKHNGCVYCIVEEQTNIHTAYSIYANIISSFYKLTFESVFTVDKLWEIVKYENFIPKSERERPVKIIRDHLIAMLSNPFFVLPEMLSEREKRQHAAFLVFPNDIDKSELFIDRITDQDNINKIVLMIEAIKKKKILSQLELFGISEQFLFPETDKKCEAIKEQTKNLINEKWERNFAVDESAITHE